MRRFAFSVMFAAITLMLAGCVSTSSLPQSAAEADFSKTGFVDGMWHDSANFQQDVGLVAAAAHQAILNNGLKIREDDPTAGRIVGEHAMTFHTWYLAVGIYYKPALSGGTAVHTVALRDKDRGILRGDQIEPPGPRVLASMSQILSTQPSR